MSGGAFDYNQYHIDDIVAKIEYEIERATCERPELVKYCVCSKKSVMGMSSYSYLTDYDFKTLGEAKEHFKSLGYRIDKKTDKEFEAVSGDFVLLVEEDMYSDYYPDYTAETIKELRRGVEVLKKASVYAQRIDWLLSGDDDEKSFHRRLKEDLDNLNNK